MVLLTLSIHDFDATGETCIPASTDYQLLPAIKSSTLPFVVFSKTGNRYMMLILTRDEMLPLDPKT